MSQFWAHVASTPDVNSEPSSSSLSGRRSPYMVTSSRLTLSSSSSLFSLEISLLMFSLTLCLTVEKAGLWKLLEGLWTVQLFVRFLTPVTFPKNHFFLPTHKILNSALGGFLFPLSGPVVVFQCTIESPLVTQVHKSAVFYSRICN